MRRRSTPILSALSLLLAGTALAPDAQAHSPSGLGLPGYGGGLSSPSQDGAQGLALNPAAAHPERPEVMLDAGYIRYRYGFQLEGADPVPGQSHDLLPYLAAAVPLGPVGLGINGGLPYARSGSSEAVGPQRFHTIVGRLMLMELDLSLAWQATPWLTVGASARGGRTQYRSIVAIDSGAMVNSLLGEELAPLGDPLLEGTRSVESATGWAWGWTLGARVALDSGLAFAAGYRSPTHTTIHGPVQIVPSNDLNMALEGDLVGSFAFPPEAFVASAIPIGPAELDLEGGWIGWSSMARVQQRADDVTITSDDPILAALLASYGLDDPSLLGTLETEGVYGLGDMFTAAVATRFPVAPRWRLLTGVYLAQAAMATEFLAPGNFDYATVDGRLVASWSPVERTTISLAGDWIHYRSRTVTDSIYAWDNTPEQGPALPPAEGDYWFRMFRVGATVTLTL
jgi:long-subunit fatty acid transport protein